MVQDIIGVILITAGLILILVGVLVWLGVLKPVQQDKHAQKRSSILDLLIVILNKAPWVVAVGLILILFGVLLLGIELPF